MTAAATVESSFYTDANAAGFLQKVAYGATIIPFSIVIVTTQEDVALDRVKLIPMVARGGRNRLIGLLWSCGDLDTGTQLDADLVVYQNGADTIIYNAGSGFQSAVSLNLLLPNLTLDDTTAADSDGYADLCLLVNTAAQTPLEGTISGLLIYE